MSADREVFVKLRCACGVMHVVTLARGLGGTLDVKMETDQYRNLTDEVTLPWSIACVLERPQ